MTWSRSANPSQEAKPKVSIAGLSHKPLFVLGVLLSIYGLLMIYSSSAILGFQKYGDSLYFVKAQALFFGLGWLGYFITAQIPMATFYSKRLLFLGLAVTLLILVLIPGIGIIRGGAQRWINLGFYAFEPSEIVRLLLVFYLAATLVAKINRLKSFNQGFLPLLTVTSLLMGLLILQPDFGAAVSLFAISLSMWFIGGVPMSYLSGLVILSLPSLVLLVYQATYRSQRILSFLDPWADAHGSGFQVIQSYMAYFQGGWTGVGLGQGQQKLFYIPDAHTDFILSVVGEELGVMGVSLVVALFVGVLIVGARITRAQTTHFAYYLAAGTTIFLVLPAVVNMMVTLGLLPTKGLPLPFFSKGGSSLLVSLVSLGILQSLHRHSDDVLA